MTVRFSKSWLDRVALGWLLFWIVVSPIAMLATDGGASFELTKTLFQPTLAHPFGFDAFGRDLFLLTATAGLRSLSFAVAVVIVSIFSAIIFTGLIASAPRVFKFTFLRGLDFLLAFPSLIVALAWAAIRGPGWSTLWFSLLIGILPMLTRLFYARAQEILVQDYIEAARSLGGAKSWIIFRHLMPQLFSIAWIKAPNLFAQALIAEATLSFLGLGAPIGHDTWGSLLAQGKDYLIEAPHLAIGVGIPLILTVLSLQKLSESMPS